MSYHDTTISRMKQETLPQLCTVEEASKALKCSTRTIERLAKTGKLEMLKISQRSKKLITVNSLRTLIKESMKNNE